MLQELDIYANMMAIRSLRSVVISLPVSSAPKNVTLLFMGWGGGGGAGRAP